MDTEIQELQDHINQVSGQLERLEKQKVTDYRRQKELTERLPGMELERAKLGQEIEKTDLQLQLVKTEKSRNESQQSNVNAKLEVLEDHLGKRMKSLYKRGPLGYSQVLLKDNEIENIILSMYYIENLTKKDRELFHEYRDLNDQLVQSKKELLELEQREKEKAELLQEKNIELERLLKKRKKEISVLFQKSKERESLLKKLSQEKEELETLVEKLEQGDYEANGFPPIPITHYKGRLDWPVTGEILRHFGVFRDAQFSTKRVQNGLDIGVSQGQAVKAVYGGKVIFSDWFKSYGNLIIIDHGRKYISFYAHNKTLLVKKGDSVERNQVIAEAGDSGSLEGPFLHFEIRQSTKAEDPAKWLKKRRRRY